MLSSAAARASLAMAPCVRQRVAHLPMAMHYNCGKVGGARAFSLLSADDAELPGQGDAPPGMAHGAVQGQCPRGVVAYNCNYDHNVGEVRARSRVDDRN